MTATSPATSTRPVFTGEPASLDAMEYLGTCQDGLRFSYAPADYRCARRDAGGVTCPVHRTSSR